VREALRWRARPAPSLVALCFQIFGFQRLGAARCMVVCRLRIRAVTMGTGHCSCGFMP
jgi:hypothetical protein